MSHTLSDELKPCPFCGGDAHVIQMAVNVAISAKTGISIQCKSCWAESAPCMDIPTAAAAWNRRAALAAQPVSEQPTEENRLRFFVRRSNASAEGKHAQGYGLRVGYWPCLRAPYISVSFAIWHIELWYGLPSYRDSASTAKGETE